MGFRKALVVCLLGLATLVYRPLLSQQPLFRAGTELVDLYVTVTDENGRLVPDLTRDDFAVFDDQSPQEIALFENDVRPITVVVMLDTSGSMTMHLNLLMAGAEQFLIRMLPEDRGRVGAFNDKIEIEPATFTGDRDQLIAALDLLDFGNPTLLFDALAASLDALQGIDGRKVILVLTDGEDTGSEIGSREVLDRAVTEEVMIYAIGLESIVPNSRGRQTRTRPDRNLRKFAEETGGGYFELRTTDELGSTFTRVAQELHSQYVLGFVPTQRDGDLHAIRVVGGTSGHGGPVTSQLHRAVGGIGREPGQPLVSSASCTHQASSHFVIAHV